MKKNRALRNLIITGVVALVVSVVLFVMGTVLFECLEVPNVNPFVAIAPKFSDYGVAFIYAISIEIWGFTEKYFWFDLAFVVFLGITLIGFVVILIASRLKRSKKLIGVAIADLIFGLVLTYEYLVCFAFKYGLKGYYEHQMAIVQGFADLFTKGIWWEMIWVLVNMIACFISFVVIVALPIVAVCQKKACCKACEAKEHKANEVVTAPVAVQQAPVAAVEAAPRKKAVLIVKRYDKLGANGPIVERPAENYPREIITQKALTAEEVRACVRDELERNETRRLAEAYRNEKQAEAIAQAVIKAQGKTTKEVVEPKKADNIVSEGVVETKEEEEKVYPTPIIFAMPTPVTNDVAKEVKKENPQPVVAPISKAKAEKKGLTEDEVKAIIASEIKEALKDFVITHETVIEKPVEVRLEVKKPVDEKVEEVSNVSETVVKVEETPAVRVEPEVKVEPKVDSVEDKVEEPQKDIVVPEVKEEEVKIEVEETPVVEETPATENVEVAAKPERIPFSTRMLSATDDLKNAYNELKSLLKSYGLNNRVANGGDSFRLHRVTFCKITIAGKSLKLYLALNPEDYKDSTYPIKDAGSKAMYKETPLVFKVKSKLSVKRAEELIRDCMDKNGLEQVSQVEVKDWASSLANINVDDDSDDFYEQDE